MNKLVMLIGLIICIEEVMFFLKYQLMEGIIRWVMVGKRIYVGAVIKIIFGVILLMASKGANFPFLIMLLGCLTIIGSGATFVMGLDKTKQFMTWILNHDERFKRNLAIYGFVVGLLLVVGA